MPDRRNGGSNNAMHGNLGRLEPAMNKGQSSDRDTSAPIAFHALASEQVLQKLDVDPQAGLSNNAIAERRNQYGTNTILQYFRNQAKQWR